MFYLWAGSSKIASIMHARMLFSSLGGMLSPLVLSSFLVDLPEVDISKCNLNTQLSTASPSTLMSSELTTLSLGRQNKQCITITSEDVALVKWSFVFSSCCMIIPMIFMAVTSFASLSTTILPQSTKYNIELASKQESAPAHRKTNALTCLFVGTVTLLVCFFMSMCAAISQYLQTFAVVGLHWSIQSSAYLNVAHNGGYIFGRILGMPLSYFVNPSLLVVGSLVTGTIGILLILYAGLNVGSDIVLWAGVIIAGMGRSLVTSCLLIWTNQITGLLTPVQSAMINVGMCAGFMIGPVVTSTVYPISGHMSMVYVALVSNIIQYAVIAVLMIIAKQLAVTEKSEIFSTNKYLRKNSLIFE